jgi:hypothetical protein
VNESVFEPNREIMNAGGERMMFYKRTQEKGKRVGRD